MSPRFDGLNGGLVIYRNGKAQNRPTRATRIGPQSSAVHFDDGTADRQTNADAALLGGNKRLENALAVCGRDPRSRVDDRDQQRIGRAQSGADDQLPLRFFDSCHSARAP